MDTSLSPPEFCSSCNIRILNNEAYCQNCGFPLLASEKEQNDFLLNRDIAQIDLEGYNLKIERVRNWFYYLAGLLIVIGIIVLLTNKDNEDILALVIPQFILAILFLILGSYSMKKPLACIVSGLSLYIIVQILNAIQNPILIAKGFIFKIIIIGVLIRGIKSAIEIEKIRKEHPSI